MKAKATTVEVNPKVSEYVRSINDDALDHIYTLLQSGDRCGASDHLSEKDEDLNKWLSSAKNPDEVFDMLDSVLIAVKKERKDRGF
jgi:hypothetical protein